ncbi:MAG TPA: AI-2E family transporter [Candidatus Thermoplasmatota archaeon]|nr:AI-2E family transporter [Candidatus Thermoplasmatota archaeon]
MDDVVVDAPAATTVVIKPRMPFQSRVFFFIILAVVLYLTWKVFHEFIIVLITGVFVAVLALPIDKMWERIFPNRVAAIFTMLTLFLILTIPLIAIGFGMYHDATKLADAVQGGELDALIDRGLHAPWAQRLLEISYPDANESERVVLAQAKVDEGQAWVQRELTDFGTHLIEAAPTFFIGIAIILFVVYYALTDGDTFVAYLRRAVPIPGRQVDFLLSEARVGLRAVFFGQILMSVLQGIVCGIGWWIAGLPSPILWGAVMAIFALLPVVGTFMVWVPGSLYLLVQGHLVGGVFLLLWGTIVVLIILDTFLRPKIIGYGADIHPMLVLVGVLGGAAAFGFIGLFLGPLIVGILIAVLKVYEADYLDPEINDPTAPPPPPPRPHPPL